jgi:crotonobetainyl-CoA:carnitine CoA-transferase CaiB-like acyl-CoA transferase
MKPLDGIKVLDLTHAHAGPICTLFLGALGAEIIKIEPPWGEMTRFFPPLIKDVSPYFAFLGRCKKSVTLNLKESRGKELFKEMVKRVDIVVENFSPGTMEELGIGWKSLKEINPGIILASISGFGQTGPWKDRRSYDPIAQAASGFTWLMKDMINEGIGPQYAPEAIGDTIPGLFSLIGVLAALNMKNETGQGQWIDVAQMDSMIAVLQSFSFWNLADTTFIEAVKMRSDHIYGIYQAKDGDLSISITEGRISDWVRQLLDVEEIKTEDIKDWVADKKVEKVVEILSEKGIPVSPINDLDQVLNNPQAREREMFVKVDHTTLGEMELPGFPIKFSDAESDITVPAPVLGEQNDEVFKELLNLNQSEIEELRKKGII